ncbi:hypothetical protein Acr_22g0007320 [Actinidia rufa]|uniref:Uncharacterized protein n=1 Tax=Actinidia rufa TaxID=165716 RepID=A0A7J0GKU2_9ERIC|nr:hypothetical protein Acr_22g0007320 [Actinidia rufa]
MLDESMCSSAIDEWMMRGGGGSLKWMMMALGDGKEMVGAAMVDDRQMRDGQGQLASTSTTLGALKLTTRQISNVPRTFSICGI